MSTPILEAFLARIYVDPHARERFLSNPGAEASAAGLSPDEIEAVQQIDRVGLELFAASLERKKQKQHARRGRRKFLWRKRIS